MKRTKKRNIQVMKIKYDAEVDVLMIYPRDGKYVESDHVAPNVIVDFDDNGTPLVIEILNAHQLLEIDGTLNIEMPFQIAPSWRQ